MRKTKKSVVMQEVEETVDVTCNNCGLTCFPPHSHEPYGLIEHVIHGGYFSTHLGDMRSIRFSLCESCIADITSKFKILPDVNSDTTPGFIPGDQEQKYNDEYQKAITEAYAKVTAEKNK